MVVSVPASPDRYYVLQWFDLYPHNFAYRFARDRHRSRRLSVRRPRWDGEVPKGIKKVFRPETQIVGTLTRTSWTGSDDRDGLVAMQQQYRIRPLSEYMGSKPPPPTASHQFPAWDETRATSVGFIPYLNFILQFTPPVAGEKMAFARFAKLGIGAHRAFDAASLDPQIRQAIEAGIKDGQNKLQAKIDKTTSSTDLFGTRESLGADYVMRRAVGAAMGRARGRQQLLGRCPNRVLAA